MTQGINQEQVVGEPSGEKPGRKGIHLSTVFVLITVAAPLLWLNFMPIKTIGARSAMVNIYYHGWPFVVLGDHSSAWLYWLLDALLFLALLFAMGCLNEFSIRRREREKKMQS